MKTCSFCGNYEAPGRRLAAGAGGIICEDCVRLFQLALDKPRGGTMNQTYCHFCRRLSAPNQGIWVKDRGHLCQDCVSAIQAELADA